MRGKNFYALRLTGGVLAAALLSSLAISVAPSTSQATGSSEIGVPTLDSSSKMTKLVYADGTVAQMSYTNVGIGEPTNLIPATMAVKPSDTWWWGWGDVSTAFSPTTLAGGQGLVLGWESFKDRTMLGCLPSTDTANPQRMDWTQYPHTNTPYVCSTPATVTFTFSRPTTDAILNLHNLAGGAGNATQSFYSSWKLNSTRSPGLSAELVSKVGNFEVANGDTIQTIQPPGTGITTAVYNSDPSNGQEAGAVSTALDIAPQGSRNYYGSGSGAVKIVGTYTVVSFDVTLRFYVNTELNTPYYWDYNRLEYVQMNWNIPTALPPDAVADTTSGPRGAVQTKNLLTNDVSRPGDDFNLNSVRLCNIAAGTPETAPNCTANSVTVNGVGTYTLTQGTVSFTPLSTYTGTPTPLPYIVKSGLNLTASSTYTPTIVPPPTASNDTSSGPLDTAQDQTVLSNDSSGNGVALSASTIKLFNPANSTYGTSAVTVANQGTYTISGNKIVFTPVTGYVGTATPVTYQISDSLNQTATATYTPTIMTAAAWAAQQARAAGSLAITGAPNPSGSIFTALLIAMAGGSIYLASMATSRPRRRVGR